MIFRTIIRLILVLLATCLIHIQSVGAVKIVRLQLEYGSNDVVASGGFDIPKTNKTLDLELYDDITPITVANYLDYVNSNAYDLTFINRSIPGFVLQTGGVTNISDPIDEPIGPTTTFVDVIASSPIINEPGLSNTRGTIAMAKIPDQPDSATSEWFINLKDNSNPLDTDNGGFTVFGSIIDDGMETADQIATFPILNIPNFITDLPIADADPNPDPNVPVADFVQSNLVMILSAAEINRPILRFTPTDADFGFETPGVVTGKTINVVVKNTGNEILDIAPDGVGSVSIPFSIQSEDCSNTSLVPVSTAPASSCTVILQFLPTETGVFTGSLIIDYTGQVSSDSFSVKYPLLGEGALGQPEIVTVDELDITSQVDGFSSKKDIIVRNNGQASLQVSAISDLSSTGFSQTNDCIGSNVLIAPDDFCTITVSFTASEFDTKIATLSIESNDPVNNSVDITLSGYGDSDADGVLSAIEDAAPNAGDNNIDGTADSLQNSVASFTSSTGEYISLWVDSNNVIANISTTPDNQLIDLPTDVVFKYGVLEYDVAIDTPGAIIDVGQVLPAGTAPVAYYLFGETEDNATPHWYRYEVINILANSTFVAPNGERFTRNLIKITVQDGGPGDADKIVNGRVTIGPAAAAYPLGSSDSSSGSLSILLLSMLFVLLLPLRRIQLGLEHRV